VNHIFFKVNYPWLPFAFLFFFHSILLSLEIALFLANAKLKRQLIQHVFEHFTLVVHKVKT
jgi:hypothetical protein